MRDVLAVLAVVGLGLAPASAAQQAGKTTTFAVKGILLLPGEAYVEEVDAFFDIDMGFGVAASVDTRLGERITGGLFLDLLSVSAYDETGSFLEIGAAIKAAFNSGPAQPTWRPGIGFGYGTLSAVGGIGPTNYFLVRGSFEVQLPSQWVAEAILWGAPSGGNEQVTVTYGPMVQLRVGRAF